MSSSARKTVLCVEDEEPQLELRQKLFESAGFECHGARSGAEALELFRTRQIDAVVLDYWVPDMKGIAIAESMKRQRPAVPIVMLSGLSSLPGEGLGIVSAWFRKGNVEPEELINEVRRLTNTQSANSVNGHSH